MLTVNAHSVQRGPAEVEKGNAGAEHGLQGQLQLLVRADDEDSPAGTPTQSSSSTC